ncbi:MAG: methylase involved in ubiquinone/menaquinone biosynthesis [Schlesneria sp.]|nr:methylase involved in ubiquinone/menaquinone biosynthesis [Schlesneria sp.]
MSPAADSTTRFSNRVADYVRYRPSYPAELIQTLQAEAGLTPQSIVADVGSGTGISADLFLRLGCTVYGIEPNADMRGAAEARFAGESRFRSTNATAEVTSLPSASVDLIAAGQAFHWFDRDRTRAEFSRILRSNGYVALFWNSRRTESTPFLRAYEALLNEFATDYQQINHTNIDKAVIAQFFAGRPFETRSFPSSQDFDFEGLRGRLLSSSYAPAVGQPRHEAMLLELERLYREHQSDNKVRFEYDTELYFGRLN